MEHAQREQMELLYEFNATR
ncbi:hypothetical protein, partial [Bifidobacterium sp. UBA6881]